MSASFPRGYRAGQRAWARTAASVLALAACCSFAQSPAPAAAERQAPRRIVLADRIIAVVNKEVITERELADRLQRVELDLRGRGTPLPEGDLLRRQVLERLIMDRVQTQFAAEIGVGVDDLQLDQAVARIAEANRMPLVEFRRAIEADGVPFRRFREEVRREIVLQRLREREVDSRISVAENEVDIYIAEQAEKPPERLEYNLSHVLVRVPEQAGPELIEQRRARAEEAVKRLQAGNDFAQVAATYSDGPDALQGGAMGWRGEDRLPELFVEALAKLRPGDVSPVLRSPAGFHVLKLVDRRGAGTVREVEQNRARHILVRVNELVSESEARRRLVGVRERIVNGADFAEMARAHSDDSSASRGGDLGWVYPGDTVPDFERAMRSLKPGEVSEPVRTPFGFHLIQVVERRVADVSAERKRVEARRVLRERKVDEAYQEWLRQLRDRSYVELRLDDR